MCNDKSLSNEYEHKWCVRLDGSLDNVNNYSRSYWAKLIVKSKEKI
jgi:hypothetical protein